MVIKIQIMKSVVIVNTLSGDKSTYFHLPS